MSSANSSPDAEFDAQALQLKDRLPALREWAESRRLSGKTTERAFVVEFAGMPKAGKSSAIQTLRHFFSHGTKLIIGVSSEWEAKFREGYIVHAPAEGVSLRTPNYLKPNLWDFNSWAGAYALQELLQARHDRYHDLVILDRGPWHASCWLEYVLNNKAEDVHVPEDAKKIVGFFELPHWATLSDLHVVLTVDPTAAKERERKQRLIEHGGPSSNPKLMSAMRQIYQNRFPSLAAGKLTHCKSSTTPAAVLIDTTNLHPKELALTIISATLDLVDAKLANMPSKQPLTIAELRQLFEPVLANASGPFRTEFDTHAPVFLDRVGRMSERQRQFARGRLAELVGGVSTMLNISRKDELGNIRESMDQILVEAEDE